MFLLLAKLESSDRNSEKKLQIQRLKSTNEEDLILRELPFLAEEQKRNMKALKKRKSRQLSEDEFREAFGFKQNPIARAQVPLVIPTRRVIPAKSVRT